ncbi:hypothetical protein FVEN_g8936 [Fusarium venenatum]|uniref:Endosomal spry domain-containing protein n=1 Tax=Fusarium venenatum TaxID=56646 RepID=A0A2L2TJS2_9HYPO|nr:uncharacterized protein FVRRES_02193 [Fusarium venenatum]KAG8353115.1 hypothetical protein FVEN_g8936 [Fusarium venenatum]KAH7004679.1 hypothetical protein EDB82DRAFT_487593 [Fusarium venenatum]CEI65681.1 unnamed protein product [Fusarium venenatum]
MAPALIRTLRSAPSLTQHAPKAAEAFSTLSGHLLKASKVLVARDDKDDKDSNNRHKPSVVPDSGSFDPHDINNAGFFFLFALIGVVFVCTGIWFFFWAKNGGFQFKENDWDDYKSTVLRRTGPNGTILSNATRPTNLGGGSVYKDVDDDNTTVVTESTTLTGITAGASDIYAREKRRRKQEKRDRERAKKGKKTSRHVGDEGVEDEDAERAAKKELRNYRHERAARVGGLNKESEGSEWDGSTNNGTESNVSTNLLSDRQTTPTTTPTKAKGGIRKVYSTADRRENREAERMRAEARRLREAGRNARRDFSYQRAESYSRADTQADSQVSESLLSGSQLTRTTDDSGDLGTKSYHHPMPELREMERERAREERRARRAQREARRGRTIEEE